MRTMLTVPAEMVIPLRSGLHSSLQLPVEGLADVADREGRECHPEWYAKHFAHLDEVLALLDVVGWSAADQPAEVEIDLCEHRWALLKAIEAVARVAADELDAVTAIEADRAVRGETSKCKTTLRRLFAVNDFCWTVVIRIVRVDAEQQTSRRAPRIGTARRKDAAPRGVLKAQQAHCSRGVGY
jgi:hypothetical protein